MLPKPSRLTEVLWSLLTAGILTAKIQRLQYGTGGETGSSKSYFKNRIRILLALTKNQFKHAKKKSYQTDFFKFFMLIFFYLKNAKIHLKM